MPKTLIDVTSPSPTRKLSLLLDLPIEIQIEIIELLQDDWRTRPMGQRHPHPLKSLRLTCKQLESLCNPVFANFIFIGSSLDRPELELRNELASKFAKYLKRVIFFISGLQEAKELFMESVLTAILDGAVHLRKLSIIYLRTDTGAHNQLLSAISRLGTLEDVKIWELEYPLFSPPDGTIELTFNHRLLNHILDYHSQRLRVLVVSSGTPMLESTFLKLRDTASQLRHLELNQCLTIETRGAFTDPQIWACADRLEDLSILRCAIRPATIVRHVGAGVFGPLRTLYILRCGDDSGDPPEPAAAIWTIPPLNWVHVDQFNDREMDSLRSIHAKKVFMRRVWSGRPLCIEAFRKSTTFPEVAELHVEKGWDDKDFEELKRSCAMRGLTMVKRDLEDKGSVRSRGSL